MFRRIARTLWMGVFATTFLFEGVPSFRFGQDGLKPARPVRKARKLMEKIYPGTQDQPISPIEIVLPPAILKLKSASIPFSAE